ncbi:MAG: hypothetical protein CSA81_01835 [Acidobacteria bacterium]|nr:MAG: hypothetical protein CSA81_01835 [Acidobacteriota bacterium]
MQNKGAQHHSVHIAIPVFNELDCLPKTMACLSMQRDASFQVWICLNEPPHTKSSRPEIHQANTQTRHWLEKTSFPFPVEIVDALDDPEVNGVGMARNLLATLIYETNREGITLCLDADTLIPDNYVACVRQAFNTFTDAVAVAAPYYHPVPENRVTARQLLRYEIYMRLYQLGLWSIGSPYAYLAIGSAMSYRNRAWKQVRGIPARTAGEDFYFLQKLRKMGDIIRWIPVRVSPAPRISDRVSFGTGTLLKERDLALQKTRFPFFHANSFQKIGAFYSLFKQLFHASCPLPIDAFLVEKMKGQQPFDRIRANSKTERQFASNAHQYFDALRILQFLRYDHQKTGNVYQPPVDVDSCDYELLDAYRNELFAREEAYQRRYMKHWRQRLVSGKTGEKVFLSQTIV